MKNFFQYLTTSEEEQKWGLALTVNGRSETGPDEAYPSSKHPNGYYFTWENGRILHEYQINYITEGSGILENRFGSFELKRGTVFITYPGEWHRYRPKSDSGWTENYIGFSGSMADRLLNSGHFSPKQPLIHTGVREEIIDTYLKIFELSRNEKPGFQYIASGMIVKLLGYLISFEKEKDFSGKEIARVIEAVRFEIRQKLNQEPDFQQMAAKHHVSYSYLRKMFKKYTGVSPGQYHLQLRIMRAKELIVTTEKSIKEVSYELGFQSIHYFSRLFKDKTGLSPLQLRNQQKKGNSL
ncbi:AraC family transcriptional regulator [Roseimarinus sediminis]|jgi:AraC-like DNA-binding protein|uniref:AraC family transcriptional regulator n=1 Tax=Roseimarinus sediminis TaxID=1610899 RepID=UPI003D211CED